ncbi:GlxA family transcriptional regulator [Mameliella alba]|uniref:GlxA family transcriptional regulator n=1 Tax=Mameliella alba TaxID=561184 RepID=UPI00142F77F3|nr:helix-turn-helix domain-containing protein [Mameliella alba]
MTKKIGFLLFPGFPMACLTSVIEPLRAANEISRTTAFEWTLVAEASRAVQSSAGIPFEPQTLLEDVDEVDYLLLLSAPAVKFADPRSAAHLRRLGRHGCTLGAISGGVFPLVRSGAVPGERLSVHWCYEAAFATEFPEIPHSDEVIEVSRRCVTASGAAAAFDLALGFIDAALGGHVATEVACWFQHPMMRKIGVKQSVPVHLTGSIQDDLSPIVSRAIEVFAADMTTPVSVAELAERLEISPRHLERSFKQATGQNPTTYFRWLRMQAARQIVMYTNDAVADVAAAVGYASAKHFTRHYRAEYGLSPQEDRKRINLYRTEGNRPVPSV